MGWFQQKRAVILVILAVGGLAFVRSLFDLKVGDHVEDFSLFTTDGKSMTLASLTQNQDLFLYFVKPDCPFNAEALPYLSSIYRAYGDKSNMLGVFTGDIGIYRVWQPKENCPIPMALDPFLEITRKLQASYSPWIIQIDRSGTVKHVWKGYSTGALEEINAAVAQAAGLPKANISMLGAPEGLTHGCPFR